MDYVYLNELNGPTISYVIFDIFIGRITEIEYILITAH